MDTIFAISSGRPPAAIAVMRISGPDARDAAAGLAGTLPSPRRAALRRLRDAAGETLDHALCIVFPGPATATGEDLVELHLHGGAAVIAAVERALAARPNLRRAEPGEFTRRALGNGRVDLAQAQGLADLLEAETEQQRKLALRASEGQLSRQIRAWLARLSDIAAQVEAMIDFDEEGDVPSIPVAPLWAAAADIAAELRAMLDRPSAEHLRDGIRVVLAGAPNAGKSSLFNALLEREAAIVTPIPGTTRDTIEARVVRSGQIFTLVDTAGIRDEGVDDPVERIGIDRARDQYRSADLIIALDETAAGANVIRISPKADLGVTDSGAGLAVSIRQPATIAQLWEHIAARAAYELSVDGIALDRAQRDAVAAAWRALSEDSQHPDLLIFAEALRFAGAQLGKVIGINATEAMLDALFARFCLGK